MVYNKRIPSVMSHTFSEVPRADIPRSSFDRSCGVKTTFDAGYLVPVFVDEVLPGDTFTLDEAYMARMATPIFPLMDNLFLDVHYFFVPMRLVWENWQKFCGEQKNPNDSTDFITPIMEAPAKDGYLNSSLHDYFGLPTQVPGFKHVSYFHRAYNLIWNDFYRDENLQDSVVVDTDNGPDDPVDYKLLKRGKRHDYFTSCLPWPQKGPSVDIPVGTRAPVHGLALAQINNSNNLNYSPALQNFTTEANLFAQAPGMSVGSSTYYGYEGAFSPFTPNGSFGDQNIGSVTAYWNGTPTKHVATTPSASTKYTTPQFTSENWPIYADLGSATASTINALRQAFQIQRLYERDARGGTRYIEILKSHFGVTSPDARLQRPEYLGGSSTPVHISPIPQTSSTDTTSPQGNLAAVGTVSSTRRAFSKSFVEHGVIIGLASVRADLNYQQGLDRMWSRRTRWDFYWPALSHIGEQAVLNKEIYCQGNEKDEEVFGYQERFAEYRYKTSKILGQFRSNFAQSLDSWHLAQDFSTLPTLSDDFIQESPPMERVLSIPTYPDFILDGWYKLRCARPMPVYSVPGMIDRF